MVNLEYKLTVDDLIVEYMIYKVENGYEPSFTTGEFIKFLLYFEGKMSVYDALYDGVKLFERFFERKNKTDWITYSTKEGIPNPHMNMEHGNKAGSYIIKANYKLSGYDKSVINTFYMNRLEVVEIRSVIADWLRDYPKREEYESTCVDENELMIGKYIAVEIIRNIWDSYVRGHIKNNRWPTQCTDMDKYLFEVDLAEIINVKSIKNELIELYKVFSKRIAILYHQDKELKIKTSPTFYLARSNYELLIRGYEDIMDEFFGVYKRSLDIDLSTLTFEERHEIDGTYDLGEFSDIRTTTITIGDDYGKKLTKILDERFYK